MRRMNEDTLQQARELVERLRDPDWGCRLQELASLGGNWRVRRGCAAFLDHHGKPGLLPELIPLLDDPKSDVRFWAVHALGCDRCKDEACLPIDPVPHLIRRLEQDESIRVRRQALTTLVWTRPGDRRILQICESLLAGESDRRMRLHAAYGVLKVRELGASPMAVARGEEVLSAHQRRSGRRQGVLAPGRGERVSVIGAELVEKQTGTGTGRDRELVASQRWMEAEALQRHFPFPLPDGWFQVAYSDELVPGGVLPLRYFGRDLVLFRSESGRAVVMDAHCPHLGAHLGVGGRVSGESLRCPFHGWRFDCEGRCVEVPYARRISPSARVATWAVVEQNGFVMVWHHARREPPSWSVPVLSEYGDPEWTPWKRLRWRVRTRNQELAENGLDVGHFPAVHGTVDLPRPEIAVDGHRIRCAVTSRLATPRGLVDSTIETTYYGLGLGVARFRGICDAILVTSFVPVDEETVETPFSYSIRRVAGADAEHGVGAAIIRDLEAQMNADIPIWENKVYREQPLLCDGDAGISSFRAWASQFYSGSAAESAA
jgi:nitrite reductase/ring-hydroxylating ferredoxin subunit